MACVLIRWTWCGDVTSVSWTVWSAMRPLDCVLLKFGWNMYEMNFAIQCHRIFVLGVETDWAFSYFGVLFIFFYKYYYWQLVPTNKMFSRFSLDTYRSNSSVVEWAIAVRLVGGSIPSCCFFANWGSAIERWRIELASREISKISVQ